MSQEAVFAVFGVICVLGVLFVRFCVPETRGHSLEEIEAAGTNHHKQVPVQQASH
ncbi:MAG: MFS transporter, partial [Lactiplantibacillus plantarum]|nr:MFS transporter [Lactiplantibacillus plantarum]